MAGKEGTEQPFIQDQRKTNDNTPRLWMSCRFKLGILVFIANILLYIHRVNLNMAIVCMLGPSTQTVHGTNTCTSPAHDTGTNHSIIDLDTTENDKKLLPYNSFSNFADMSKLETPNNNHTLTVLSENVDLRNGSTFHQIIGDKPQTKNSSQMKSIRDFLQYELSYSSVGLVAEFTWDKTEISLILSSYYYGAVFTPIPGGHISHKFGAKHVISVFFLITGICSLLSPVAVKKSTALLFVIRILIGSAGGLFTPAVYSIALNWTKPSQRATLLSFMISGQPFGIVIAYLTSGFLCVLGWSTIFYAHGAVMFLVFLLWLYEIRSSPAEHPRISQNELKYLTRNITSKTHLKAVPPTPWKSILLSRPQWAATLAHFSFNWSYYTLIINVPLYLKETFAYVITENGVYSAIPYIFCTVSMMFSGKLSAVVVKKKLLTLQATRKVFNGISLGGIAICILGASQVTSELRFLVVIFICISCIFIGFTFGGVIPSYADFAGIFSGTAFGIANSIGVISVILSALTAGLLTPNLLKILKETTFVVNTVLKYFRKTGTTEVADLTALPGLRHEWQNVFYVAAGMNVFSIIVYCIFGEATIQKWAMVEGYDTPKEIEVEIDDDLVYEETMNTSLDNGKLEVMNAKVNTNTSV